MNSDELSIQLQRFVGRLRSDPFTARDPVNPAMIRHWCDAIGDHNPIYTDEDVARESPYRGIVAPPAMTASWTMPGLVEPRPNRENGQAEMFALLDESGFTSVVATNADDEFVRYLRLGDRLTLTARFEGVSALKHTALGDGYFIDNLQTWRDQDDLPVASSKIRVLKYKPRPPADLSTQETPVPPPAIHWETSPWPRRRADQEILAGEVMPEVSLFLTPTLIIATAMATRDYQDVHHDRDLAQLRGSKDIFMNILTTGGFLQRYVTDWTGSGAIVRRISVRLGAPNYPYDTMTLRGHIESVAAGEIGQILDIAVVGANSLGDHAVGRVTVELPSEYL